MGTTAAWERLAGTTPKDKLRPLGIEDRRMVDIRFLDEVLRTYGIGVYLFFEKDLAHTRTPAEALAEYAGVPEYERPFVRVDRFLQFTRENDPSFAVTLQEFPLMVEIARIGTMPDDGGADVPFISGLMPFLDELDVSDP